MQQTDKYKLNLIEKTDTFSPDPLNENTQKLETQLIQAEAATAAEAKARADADAAETKARKSAVSAETKARTDAITAEAKARADADAAEAKTRADAITAEAKARADADTAETNARKSAVTTETNARKSADTALDTRVKVLEARKLVTGSYTGNSSSDSGGTREFKLGFQPSVVIVSSTFTSTGMATPDAPYGLSAIVVTSTGFKVSNNGKYMNSTNQKYHYLAILW